MCPAGEFFYNYKRVVHESHTKVTLLVHFIWKPRPTVARGLSWVRDRNGRHPFRIKHPDSQSQSQSPITSLQLLQRDYQRHQATSLAHKHLDNMSFSCY